MSKDIIIMDNVTKKYLVKDKGKGGNGFTNKEAREIIALNQMNFNLEEGKILGYIGANGAGKSTTIKILTGILLPTTGNVRVFGNDSFIYRRKNAEKIGIVFGQRSQLVWELPAIDTFKMNCLIYNVKKGDAEQRIKKLCEQMQISEIIHQPVRRLSLGQRMCCEIVAALLHNPQILFLDEPTIGLDILNKERIRELILQMNREYNTTVFLTTHDLADVDYLCNDILIINQGKKVFGGSLSSLKDKYDIIHTISITYDGEIDKNLDNIAGLKYHHLKSEHRIILEYPHLEIAATDVIKRILSSDIVIKDISVHESSLEDIVKELYFEKQVDL